MFALTARNELSLNELNNVELGLAGEAYVASVLSRNGYIVSHIGLDKQKRGDLRVINKLTGETHLIEVKTAKKHYLKSRWQWCLNKSNHTNSSYSDVIVLLAVDSNDKIFMYACPSGFFAGIQNFTMSSHPAKYAGKIAAFIQRFERLDFDSMHTTASLYTGRVQ